MKVSTCLENLEFFAYHGLYEEEKVKGGKFTLCMELMREVDDALRFEKIEDVQNYEQVYHIACEEMAIARDLIETVAQQIALRLLQEFGGSVRVSLTKHNPAGKFGNGNATVRIEM